MTDETPPTETSIAHRYAAAINAADIDALMALFADDGVLLHPAGVFADRAAMAGFYTDAVFAGKAVIEVVATARDGNREWAQIEATSPLSEDGERMYAADVFELDDAGRIVRLAIYYR